MDLEHKTKIAQQLLGLTGPHDAETLAESLQAIIRVGATDGVGNAVADMQERCAETVRIGGRRVALAFFDSAEEIGHVCVTIWLLSGRVDLRAVADLMVAAHEVHVWTEALALLHEWLEEEQ